MASASSYEVGRLIASLGLDDAEFQRGITAAEASMRRADQSMKKASASMQASMTAMGKKMQVVGKKMTTFVTLPILGVGVAAIKAAGDFEDSFANIRKTVDATEAEFQAMQTQLRALAKEVPTSVNELNRIGGIAGQLGIANDSIVTFTKTIAMLGDTTDISGEQAALSITRFMNVMGTAQGDIDRMGAAIVGLGNNFAAMESEIVYISTSLAAFGKDVGLSETEVLSFATAIAASGGQAQAASTAFQKTGAEMKKAVLIGSAELSMFAEIAGMSIDAFSKIFRQDASGAIVAFLEGLNSIQKSGQSTAVVLEELGLADVRLQREFGKVIGNIDDLNKAFGVANQSWDENTALTEEARKRYETFNSKLKITWNRIKDVGITIGNILLPTINKMVDTIQSITKRFADLDEQQRKNIIRLAGLAAAAGPVILIMGKLMKLMALNPYVAAAAGIVAVGLALKKLLTGRNKEIVALETERNKVHALTGELMNSNTPLERRQELLVQLQKINPDIVKGIDAEKIAIGQLTQNLVGYNAETTKKIALAGLEEEQQKMLGKQALRQAAVAKASAKATAEFSTALSSIVTASEAAGESLPKEFFDKYQELIGMLTHVDVENPFDADAWNSAYKELLNIADGFGMTENMLRTLSTQGAGYVSSVNNASLALSNFASKNKDEITDLTGAIEILKKELGLVATTTDGATVVPGGGEDGDDGGGGGKRKTYIGAQIDPSITNFDKYIEQLMLTVEAGNKLDKQLQQSGGAVKNFQDSIDVDLAAVWADVMKISFEKIKKIDPATYLEEQNKRIVESFNRTFNYELINALDNFSAALGEAFATGNYSQVWKGLLISVGNFAQKFGALILAQGIAIEAFKKSLESLQGAVAIIAGVALIAAGAAAKAFAAAGPEGYATGGIVPGNSYYGDKVPALVNSGEMILNTSQQAKLFSMINSPSAMGFPREIKLRAEGRDLIGVIDFEQRKQSTY